MDLLDHKDPQENLVLLEHLEIRGNEVRWDSQDLPGPLEPQVSKESQGYQD